MDDVRRPGRIGRWMPLVFGAILLFAVVAGLWNAANPPAGPAPPGLAGLRLTRTVTGAEAVAEMSRLHGKGVGLKDGYVAHYDGPSGGAVLYVGSAESEGAAAELLGQMEERIGPDNRYFTGLRPLVVEGVRLFFVRSGQESHYFWQAGDKVVWIGFDRDDPAALVAAVRGVR